MGKKLVRIKMKMHYSSIFVLEFKSLGSYVFHVVDQAV